MRSPVVLNLVFYTRFKSPKHYRIGLLLIGLYLLFIL